MDEETRDDFDGLIGDGAEAEIEAPETEAEEVEEATEDVAEAESADTGEGDATEESVDEKPAKPDHDYYGAIQRLQMEIANLKRERDADKAKPKPEPEKESDPDEDVLARYASSDPESIDPYKAARDLAAALKRERERARERETRFAESGETSQAMQKQLASLAERAERAEFAATNPDIASRYDEVTTEAHKRLEQELLSQGFTHWDQVDATAANILFKRLSNEVVRDFKSQAAAPAATPPKPKTSPDKPTAGASTKPAKAAPKKRTDDEDLEVLLDGLIQSD